MPPRSVLDLLRLLAAGCRRSGPNSRTTIGLAAAGDDLLGPLVQVGLAVPEEAGVVGDHLVDGGDRLVVVDVRVDADPVLAEVDAVRLVALERLPQVRA